MLDVRSRPGGGTTVVLRFALGTRLWPRGWWRRAPARMIMRLSRGPGARTMER